MLTYSKDYNFCNSFRKDNKNHLNLMEPRYNHSMQNHKGKKEMSIITIIKMMITF
jgi:hypothetical protein